MSKQKIGEATLMLTVGTVTVNLLQVAKLMIVSAWFGASTGILDQYFVALSVPLALQGIVVGGLMQSFIPLYIEHLANGEERKARDMLASTFGFGIVFFLALSVLVGIFARPILHLAATGFSGEDLDKNVILLRIFVTMLFCNGICDILGAFYNAHKRYFLTAAAPVAAIAVSIVYLIIFFRDQGVYALVIGYILGSLCQLVLLLLGTIRWGGFNLALSTRFLSRDFLPIYAMMLPVGAGILMAHVNGLVDQAVASTLPKGNVSILTYASRLHDVGMRLFAMGVGAALFPFLSTYVAEKRLAELRSTLAVGVRISLLMLAPLAIAIWIFGSEIVSALFQRKMFSAEDSRQVGIVWAAYSTGLFFTAGSIFYFRCLNAMKDLHPLWIATAIGIPLNIALDIVFSRYLGIVGVSLGTPIVYLFFMLFYYFRLRWRFRQDAVPPPALSPLWKSAVGIAVFGLCLIALNLFVGPRVAISTNRAATDRVYSLALIAAALLASGALYYSVLRALNVHEVRMLETFFRRVLRLPSPGDQPGLRTRTINE